MKKIYEAPEMITIELDNNDILTVSNGGDNGSLTSWKFGIDI